MKAVHFKVYNLMHPSKYIQISIKPGNVADLKTGIKHLQENSMFSSATVYFRRFTLQLSRNPSYGKHLTS